MEGTRAAAAAAAAAISKRITEHDDDDMMKYGKVTQGQPLRHLSSSPRRATLRYKARVIDPGR